MFVAATLFTILYCLADNYGRIPVDKNETPAATASILSRLTFSWITPLLWRTWRKSAPLERTDIWTLESENCAARIYTNFERHWQNEIARVHKLNGYIADSTQSEKSKIVAQNDAKNDVEIESEKTDSSSPLTPVPTPATAATSKQYQPEFYRALFHVIKYEFAVALLYNCISIALLFCSPLLLKALIRIVTDAKSKLWQGILFAFLLCAVTIAAALIENQSFFKQWNYALRFRSAVIAAVYRKALRISNDARQKYTVGELVNFVSIDAEKIFQFTFNATIVFASPITIIVAIVLLWRELGWAALAGVAFMCLIIPLNGWVARIQQKFYTAQLERKDERIKLTSEILSGVKLLKFYAWEPAFIQRLNALRRKELVLLRKASLLQAVSMIAWDLSPFFVSLLSFGAFVLASPNNTLTVERTFVSLTLMNIISIPLGLLPMIFSSATQFLVSVERVRKFLLSDEQTTLDEAYQPVHTAISEGDDIVHMKNASFAWSKTPANGKAILENINLTINPRSLTAIVGHVGAGKSSLCAAILGQLDRVGDDDEASSVVQTAVTNNNTVAYVPQQAWIQNATVRENILFGHAYNAELYQQVLDACALLPDLDMFPAGDATEIGEKGLNLSGGQKQRVSLARAAYSNAQVVVLDDPLSAVDAHV